MKKTNFVSVFAAVSLLSSCSSGDESNSALSCEQASLATMEAAFAFSNATDQNLDQLCTAYKNALAAQIDVCGDANGELQALVNNLGDCQLNAEGRHRN